MRFLVPRGMAIYPSLYLSPNLVQTVFFSPSLHRNHLHPNATFIEKGRAGEEETLKTDGEKPIYMQRNKSNN